LAIELAAARRRSLPLDELDRRLDQRFALPTVGTRTALARQQTLEALIDWSYDLLEPAEQALFERLSVFAGGFDLDAAEAVAGATGQFSADVLDRVAALVDKSLVQVNDGATTRYSLLESVREYAAIRLAARGPAAVEAVSAAHRDHYLALAELAAPRLLRSDQGEWLDRLELELDNLRATIAECALAADPELGLRLGRALYQFWLKRRPQAEGVAAVCKALDRLDARAPTAVRGLALAAAGYLLVEIAGDHRAAAARAEEALEIGLTLADDRIRAEALLDLAAASWREADDAAFLARCDAALEAASAVGDPHLTAVLLMRRAGSHLRSPEDTARDAEQSLELFLQAGDPSGILYSLINISYRELWTGQIAAAHDRLSEAIEIARTTGQRRYLMHALFNLGLALHLDRADADARPYFDEALHIASQDGNPLMEAYCQLGLALLASRAGDLATAAMLHGQADAIHEKLGTRVEGLESGLREADVGRLRSVLGQREFDSAYLAGREPMRSVGQR
jgi:hypothetical protein